MAKNETIIDELGVIEVILSDKTGTITQNKMIMKRIGTKNEEISDLEFLEKIKKNPENQYL